MLNKTDHHQLSEFNVLYQLFTVKIRWYQTRYLVI